MIIADDKYDSMSKYEVLICPYDLYASANIDIFWAEKDVKTLLLFKLLLYLQYE